MDWLVVLLIVLIVGNAATVYLLWRRGRAGAPESQSLILLQNQLENLSRAMENKPHRTESFPSALSFIAVFTASFSS